MNLGDVITYTRDLLAEYDTSGRYSDPLLTRFVYRAMDDLALELEWPESTLTQDATPGVQEYSIPPVLKVLRVYLGGQECVPTTIPTLEGSTLELFDQSTPGTAVPRWKSEPGATYPVLKHVEQGYPVPQVPWFSGMRPRFYFRGGSIGFVPTPVNTVTIALDVVPYPPKPQAMTDTVVFPDLFLEALATKAAEIAKESDQQYDAATYFRQKFASYWVPKLRRWKETFVVHLPRRPSPVTYRTFYQDPRG